MGWQDAVKGLLTNISIGSNPEAYQNAQKIQLAKAAQEHSQGIQDAQEARAEEVAGQNRMKFSEDVANRGTRDALAKLGLTTAEQNAIIATQNAKQEGFTTAHQGEKFASDEATAATNRNVAKGNLGVAQGNLGQRQAEFKAGEGQRGSEARTAAANADVAEATTGTRIAAINDPAAKWEAELPGATSILNNAIAKGTQADIDDAKAQLEAIRGEVRKARAMAAIKKQLAGKARGQ